MPKSSLLSRPTLLIAALLVVILFFSSTSPKSVPSLLLIMGFILLGILFYILLQLALLATGLHKKFSPVMKRAILIGGTALPLILLILQSIGQLTVRDVVTLGGLVLLGVFYVTRVLNIRT